MIKVIYTTASSNITSPLQQLLVILHHLDHGDIILLEAVVYITVIMVM
jgi:hypothetical protein